jgi:hypothetical protein
VYPTRTLRIEPAQSWQGLNARELWRYRELLYFFVWRDIKVRYKQTVLGGLGHHPARRGDIALHRFLRPPRRIVATRQRLV